MDYLSGRIIELNLSIHTYELPKRFIKSDNFSPDETARVTQEFVTPRYRAISAPESPKSCTPACDNSPRALTTGGLRLPDRNSSKVNLLRVHTFCAKAVKSLETGGSRKFSLANSSISDKTP